MSDPLNPKPDEPKGGGTVEVTPLKALAVAAMFGTLAGWLLLAITTYMGWVAPQVPWSAPLALLVATALVGVLAFTTHQRIQVRHEYVEPHRAVGLLVMGKASALAGALVAGGYLAFGLSFVNRFEADTPRERVIRSAVAVVSGIGMTVAGLLLERACKVPGSDDEDDAEKKSER